MWHFMLDILPLRSTLVDRGGDMDSMLCHIYQSDLFFQCSLAQQILRRVALRHYLQVSGFVMALEMVGWIDDRSVVRMEKAIAELGRMTIIWVLWMYKNAVLFRPSKYMKQFIFYNIVEHFFVGFPFGNSKARCNYTT